MAFHQHHMTTHCQLTALCLPLPIRSLPGVGPMSPSLPVCSRLAMGLGWKAEEGDTDSCIPAILLPSYGSKSNVTVR